MARRTENPRRYHSGGSSARGRWAAFGEALDPKLHRKVAIKTILMGQLDEETAKDFSVRFEREARAVARLNHPNIVQVYDFGEEGDTAYLVMELIDGKELKSALTTGRPFDRKECVRIMCELLDALDFAHEAKSDPSRHQACKRDVRQPGPDKLTDFGVARVTDADRTSAERTQAGTVVGTPAYMSPEQLQGLPIDRRTDVFSAGVILYQFLTGQKPFTGEGAWTVQKKIVQDEPRRRRRSTWRCRPSSTGWWPKRLAKDPNQRFATARQFADALRRAAEGKPAVPEAEPTLVVPRYTLLRRPLIRRHCDPGRWSSNSGARSRTATTRTTSNSTCGSFPKCLCVARGTQGRQAAQRLPADDSGTRTMAGADRTRVQRSVPRAKPSPRRSAKPRRACRSKKTVKLASAASAGEKKSLLVLGILGYCSFGRCRLFPCNKAEPTVDRPEGRGGGASETRSSSAGATRSGGASTARSPGEARRRGAGETGGEAQAQREAELKAKRDAEAQTQRAAAAQAKRDAEAQATAKLRRRQDASRSQSKAGGRGKGATRRRAEGEAGGEERAQREAKAKAQRDAESKAKLAAESSLWDSIKSSRNAADFRNTSTGTRTVSMPTGAQRLPHTQ